MKKFILALVVTLTLLSGCNGREYKFEPEWAPLVSVKEATDRLLDASVITTVGHHCYVSDISDWLDEYPPGSPQYRALLKHERTHAIRQLSYPYGLGLWLFRYVTSPEFRWEEEKIGTREEIRELVAAGIRISPESFAAFLSSKYGALGIQMVSYEEAKRWIEAVISGRE